MTGAEIARAATNSDVATVPEIDAALARLDELEAKLNADLETSGGDIGDALDASANAIVRSALSIETDIPGLDRGGPGRPACSNGETRKKQIEHAKAKVGIARAQLLTRRHNALCSEQGQNVAEIGRAAVAEGDGVDAAVDELAAKLATTASAIDALLAATPTTDDPYGRRRPLLPHDRAMMEIAGEIRDRRAALFQNLRDRLGQQIKTRIGASPLFPPPIREDAVSIGAMIADVVARRVALVRDR